MNFLSNINLNQSELQNGVIHPLGTAPSGIEGQIYYNSTVGNKKLYIHDGTSWVPVGDITSITSLSLNQLTIGNGSQGDVTLALNIASNVTNGGTGLVTSDLLYDYIVSLGSLVNSVTAGVGLVNSGTTSDPILDVVGGNGITVNANNIELNASSHFAFPGGVLTIGTGVIGSTELASTGVVAGNYGSSTTVPTFTVNADGRLTAANSTAITFPTYTIEALDGPSNTADIVIYKDAGSPDIITLAGSAYIGVEAVDATDIITLTHLSTSRSDSASSLSPTHGSNFTVVDSVSTNSEGHVTGINVKTVTLPTDNNTDTLQSISSNTTGATLYISTVSTATGAQEGYSSPNFTYNAATSTLNVTNLNVTGTQTINNVEIVETSSGIIFEGSVANEFETTLDVVNPTADRTILLPDASGTVALTSDLTAIAFKRYASLIGGSASITISGATHNLGNNNTIMIQLVEESTGQTIYADVTRSTTNDDVVFGFTTAPSASSIRVLMIQLG